MPHRRPSGREFMSEDQDTGYPRLEGQIRWYADKSRTNQRWFKSLKLIELVAAAAIPLVPALEFLDAAVTGALGVLIVVLEGLQHMNQYQQNWVSYRSTCETLRHEKYLFLGRAGPYDLANDAEAHKELVARVETLISTEHGKWVESRERARMLLQEKPGEKGAGNATE
jgi:hypothetical protein